MSKPLVGIVMGSDSDYTIMKAAGDVLTELGVPIEITVCSAHRTPKRAAEYFASAEERGLKTLICAAGMAAHLAGAAAAHTALPVIGVPCGGGAFNGQDALLSTVQMPPGLPVATVAVNGARNAGILAAQIIAVGDPAVAAKVKALRKADEDKVNAIAADWAQNGPKAPQK
jgi:phosphoribosylaminoimidazole carboxylase PurE protein